MGFDEEGQGEADAHAPSSRHILGGFVYRRLRKPKTVKDTTNFGFKGGWIHLLKLLDAVGDG